MRKILVSLVLLAITTCAYAADWCPYEDKGFFIDQSSIIKTENSTKAWTMIVGQGKVNKKKYAYMKNYIDANCSENKMANLEIIYYAKNHKPVTSYNFETLNLVKFDRVVPESRGEAIFNALCH